MDTEYRTQLIEQLRMKRRLHHEFEMKKAVGGMNTDPGIIIQAEDLAREIRSIELELGDSPSPTVQERRATPLPRYIQPEPAPAFQERMVGQQMKAKQDDIAHQMNLLNINRRNLGHLRAQMRELGAYAPPYVRNGVADAIGEIAKRKSVLRGMGQAVEDLEGDG